MVKLPDAFTLDRKIHAAGWNCFFMAAEVKAMFFGSLTAAKLQSALKRILAKVKPQHFNGLEVTAIVVRHFLGVPYVIVSAHSATCNVTAIWTALKHGDRSNMIRIGLEDEYKCCIARIDQ